MNEIYVETSRKLIVFHRKNLIVSSVIYCLEWLYTANQVKPSYPIKLSADTVNCVYILVYSGDMYAYIRVCMYVWDKIFCYENLCVWYYGNIPKP